jgi:hypothetical protein
MQQQHVASGDPLTQLNLIFENPRWRGDSGGGVDGGGGGETERVRHRRPRALGLTLATDPHTGMHIVKSVVVGGQADVLGGWVGGWVENG